MAKKDKNLRYASDIKTFWDVKKDTDLNLLPKRLLFTLQPQSLKPKRKCVEVKLKYLDILALKTAPKQQEVEKKLWPFQW